MVDINLNNVLYIFLQLSGEQNVEDWIDHCSLSVNTLRAVLKHADPGRRQEIEYAAACMAYFRYVLKKASCEAEAFRAGDVSVRNAQNKNTEFARRLLEDALAAISPFIEDKRFKFMAV